LVGLIKEASAYLKGRIRHTPVEESPGLADRLGVPVWLKLESLQETGSFKVRGALFRLSRLTAEERRTGIATCSAGNHGKGVAFAARQMGVQATIYVPSSVDETKYRGMIALGADVRVSRFAGFDDTQEWALEEAAKGNRPFISAFDDPAIIAGNGGSLGIEVLDDLPAARTFILPVGGGGLAAGFSFYAKEKYADAVIIGCQHELSPALQLSLKAGRAVTKLPAVETVAAGVEGGIGSQPFEILRSRIDRVALVSETEIFEAVRWMLDRHQYLIEPSAAVTVAACLSGKVGRLESPAVVVLSGRNVSTAVLKRILG
jgi:threonine dehydratase